MRFKGRSGHASGGRFDALTNFGSARHEYASGEEAQMLPLTQAKASFRLNDADLRGVRVKLATNPVSPHYAPMKLYRVEDLTVRLRSPEGPRARDAVNSGSRGVSYAQRMPRRGEEAHCRRRTRRAARICV